MKSSRRHSREGGSRFPVSLPNIFVASGPSAVDQSRSRRVSDAFLQTASKLNVRNDILFSESQRKFMKRATAIVADALLGPGAAPSLRLLMRRALRGLVATASTASFLLRLCALASSLDHMDFAHDIKADAELASAVDTILCPAVPPTLLVRATLFTISLLSYWLNLSMTTDSLVHLNLEHLDLFTGVESVLDLAMSCPSLMESGRGLAKLRAALGGVADPKRGIEIDNCANNEEER